MPGTGPAAAAGGSRATLRAGLVALAVAFVLASALPAVGQAGTIVVDAGDSGTAKVDLRKDSGKTLVFQLDEGGFEKAQGANSMAIVLGRAGSTDSISLAAQRDANGVWSASLPVDEPQLVAGDWTVSYRALLPPTSTQPARTQAVAQRALQVALADTDPPRLEVLPQGDPIRLGPGGALEVSVEEEFLRSITIQHSGMPTAVALPEPYRLPVDSLPEGLSNVTVQAMDRAGHVSTVSVKVDRDTVAPVLAVSVPAVGYAGVPFVILANATERSQHTVRLLHNGSAESVTVAAGPEGATLSHVFVETVAEVGNVSFVLEAVDAVGNRAAAVVSIPIVAPPTDVRAVSVALAPGPAPYIGHPANVVATLEQLGGVTALPVVVTFSTDGQEQSFTVTVPAVGTKTVAWNVTLPAGIRTVSVHAEGPSFANETNATNQDASTEVETYLGSVASGGTLYLIRADGHGLPTSAIAQGTTKSYPLKLVESGNGVAYEFTLAGNVTVQWNPLDPIAEPPTAAGTQSSTGSTTSSSKDSPAAGGLVALLVVALAALAQRRR